MYLITTVPDDASELPEQLGSKYKFWFANQSQMFKLGREGTGENFAEKVASELCQLLDLPHAHYELATWRGKQGVVTANIAPRNARLVLGNELLAKFTANYSGTQSYHQSQHTVGRVLAALSTKGYRPPLNTRDDLPIKTPTDFFAGYILLDAWIGNTDRHHENWGLVLLGSTGDVHLAQTFDHASSLGRELTDAVRTERLTTRDQRRSVAAYIEKSRSALYRSESETKSLSTIEAFKEVVKWCGTGAQYWLGKLKSISEDQIDAVLNNVPVEFMSEPARQFARTILVKNRETLLASAKAPPNV